MVKKFIVATTFLSYAIGGIIYACAAFFTKSRLEKESNKKKD